MAYESHSKAQATFREFKFVDQTDRSWEGASAYQAVVRSHVMTEVRRKRRSKAKINAETGHYRPARLISKGPDGTTNAPKDPWSSILDDIHQTFPSLAEPLAAPLTDSDGNHESQYSLHFQVGRAVNSYSDAALIVSEEPILVEKLAGVATVHPDTSSFGKVIQNDVPIYPHHGQIEETIPKPTILGISRIDPFRALPVPPDQDTYQLLDHCKFLSTQKSSSIYS